MVISFCFGPNNVRYRTGKRAKIHFDMTTLTYNASKLAADRINAQLKQQQACIGDLKKHNFKIMQVFEFLKRSIMKLIKL